MIELGQVNKLRVVKFVDFGLYLDGGDDLEILMPLKYIPEGTEEDDILDVFVYLDSEERLLATNETPVATVGEIGVMTITHINDYGAFADWGISKELFIPYREQSGELRSGQTVLVYVYLDTLTNRLAGSMKLAKHLDGDTSAYQEGDLVDILVWRKTPQGYTAIIDRKCTGLLYHSDIYKPISTGKETKAYIRKVREDGKLDLSLRKVGYEAVEDFSTTLYTYIIAQGGDIPLHDKSDPEAIKAALQVSKKVFKKAVGKLLKEGKIKLKEGGIKLS